MTNNNQQDDSLDLADLAEDNNDSDIRSNDEIYNETRRELGDTEIEDVEFPNEISLETDPDAPFDEYEDDYRNFWRTRYSGGGYAYEFYRPALKFGYELAYSDEYSDHDWVDIEDEIQSMWNDENPDTWDDVEVSVKHGWNYAHQLQADVEIENEMMEEGTTEAEAKGMDDS